MNLFQVNNEHSIEEIKLTHSGLPKKAYEHLELIQWIDSVQQLCEPDAVRWLSGTPEEKAELISLQVLTGTLIPLNESKRPGCYLARSDPSDVARLESSTFICSSQQVDSGPTNQWKDPAEMKAVMLPLFAKCMRGRTMYVIPYTMGLLGSIEVTDSPYVALSM